MKYFSHSVLSLLVVLMTTGCPTDDAAAPHDTGIIPDAIGTPDTHSHGPDTDDDISSPGADIQDVSSSNDVSPPEPDASPSLDGGDGNDASDVSEAPDVPPKARQYCETTREMFCAYYMRCGRMHADSMEQCLEYFDETCNAVYAPHYIALEDDQRLALSTTGIEACQAHLETLECSTQIFDLDGPCEAVWQGRSAPGLPCGPGISSFVCSEGSTCVITPSFCGTCLGTVAVGEPCGTDVGRCEATASCVEGTCVRRGRPGDPCDASTPCALGASCVEGTCTRFNVVTVGAPCDASNRCPYNAICVGGTCQPQAGLGESCAQPGACRSGYCDTDAGLCRPLRAATEACSSSMQCLSGVCAAGFCDALPSACFR